MNPTLTVRVAHPAKPGRYMTINAVDYDPNAHGELWPEQEDGFVGIPEPAAVAYTAPERELAAEAMLAMLELEYAARPGKSFSLLTPLERLTVLRDRNNYIREARRSQYEEQHRPPAPAAALGRAPAAAPKPQAAPAPAASEAEPRAAAPPAGAPAWAAPQPPVEPPPPPPAPKPPHNLTTKVGVAGKFFILRNGKPAKDAPQGFATEAEAEAALAKMIEEADA